MRFQRLRRAMLAAACVSSVFVAACGGGGSVVSQFNPSRVVVVGDSFADLGQRGTRYTVNDGGVNIWTQQLASRYGISLTTAAAGGTSFATGMARVATSPDAAGNAGTPTVAAQVDTFLAGSGVQSNDLVVVSGGIGDVVAEAEALRLGQQSEADAFARVRQAGTALGGQVQRVVNAGANHVLVTGTYNLGRTPWGLQTNRTDLLGRLSLAFNEALLISLVDLGSKVLYADAAAFFFTVTEVPGSYSLNNVTEAACNSVDPGPGIGIGAGQVNAALCTPDTLARSATATLFADPIHLTPNGHVNFGNFAYDRLRARF